jgi:hypothetical protein
MTVTEPKVSGPGWSDCARQGLSVKAVKGDALMFYSLTPDGKVDQSSLHGSCPTLKGMQTLMNPVSAHEAGRQAGRPADDIARKSIQQCCHQCCTTSMPG